MFAVAYCYKIFEIVNCLLQQRIYYYIKIVIKIFKVYCNDFFFGTNLLPQILLQCINYCNNFDVIATIFFVAINIFYCSGSLVSILVLPSFLGIGLRFLGGSFVKIE